MNRYNQAIFDSVTPPKKSRKNFVGVELEFRTSYPKSVIGYELSKLGIKSKISVGTDGSIVTDDARPFGIEVRVCDTEDNINKTIAKVLSVLKNLDCQTDESCGLHVHLDMRNRNPGKVYKKLYEAYSDLKKKVAKHRLTNENCNMNRFNCFHKERKVCYVWDRDVAGNPIRVLLHQPSKYSYINTLAYKEKKTLECRLHEGTLNIRKINKWINSLLKVVNG